MSGITEPISRAASWVSDDLLGQNPDTGPIIAQPVPGAGAAGAGAPPSPTPPATSPAASVPQVMPASTPPMVQNIINPPQNPNQPPAFGSAPESSKPIPKGMTPTFLGQSSLPQRQRAAGSFGFDQKNTGTKTLIGR